MTKKTWQIKEIDEEKRQIWNPKDIDIATKSKAIKISPQSILDTNEKNIFVQMNTTEAKRLAIQLLLVAEITEQKDYNKMSMTIYLEKQTKLQTYPIGVTVTEQENKE